MGAIDGRRASFGRLLHEARMYNSSREEQVSGGVWALSAIGMYASSDSSKR